MDAYISISTSVVCSVRRKPNSIRLKSSSIYLIEYPIVKPSASATTTHTLKHIITSIIKYDHNFWIKSYIKRKIPAFKGIASLNFYPLFNMAQLKSKNLRHQFAHNSLLQNRHHHEHYSL